MIPEYLTYPPQHPELIPASNEEARERVSRLLEINELSSAPSKLFLESWWSLFWLNPGLHPDDFEVWPDEYQSFVPWAAETFRRVSLGVITDSECYPAEAAHRRIWLERTGAALTRT